MDEDEDEITDELCPVCGGLMFWRPCAYCVDGFSGHDCGEDSCCCADPEDNVICDVCHGAGGFLLCVNRKNHKDKATE